MTATRIRNSIHQADQHLSTSQGTKSAHVSAPHVVAGIRVLQLLPLLVADHRIPLVFSNPEANENWQATQQAHDCQLRRDHDLAVAGADSDRSHKLDFGSPCRVDGRRCTDFPGPAGSDFPTHHSAGTSAPPRSTIWRPAVS